jgi:Ca2+/Na+ antiporter
MRRRRKMRMRMRMRMMMMMMMMIMISPFGQLGLWAPVSGVRNVYATTVYVFTYPRH